MRDLIKKILVKLLAKCHRNNLRGSYRITKFFSEKLKSLQNVPIKTDVGVIHVDLRISSSYPLLGSGSMSSGEDIVMQKVVKERDIVFDIGAHLGYYTLLLSKLVGIEGSVYAFEPNPELLANLEITGKYKKNILLQSIALSDITGKSSLFIPEDPSMASLNDWTRGTAGNVHEVDCEMKRLDDWRDEKLIPVPDFIKCDAEGAELSIFRGGEKTLNRSDAPIILFEANAKAAKGFGSNLNSYFDFLTSLSEAKFKFFEVLHTGQIHEFNTEEVEYANVIAIPKLKLAEFNRKLIND